VGIVLDVGEAEEGGGSEVFLVVETVEGTHGDGGFFGTDDGIGEESEC